MPFPPLNAYRFDLKFQKIVQNEQDKNFITRLHQGKVEIIPWPVIGSEEFYALNVLESACVRDRGQRGGVSIGRR